MMVGHFHRWFAATDDGPLPWDGTRRLLLHPDSRYFLVIAAVLVGSFAVFDDSTNLLTPARIGEVVESGYRYG